MNNYKSIKTKITKKIKNYFYLLPTIILGMSAILKLVSLTQTEKKLPIAGMEDKLLPLAILEIISITLFLIPRTMHYGFFLICSYLGGAIAVNLFTGSSSPIAPAFILALFWLALYFKRNRWFTSKYFSA